MNYQITSDNIELSPSMKSLAQTKMRKIEDRLKHIPDNLKSVRMVMNKLKDDRFEAKIHLVIKGKDYFAQELGYTLENAVVAVVDLIERDLQTDKVISTEEDWKEARDAKRFDPDDFHMIEEQIVGN